MAYRPPVFNLFAKVFTVPGAGSPVLRGYCPVQLRGPTNSLTYNAGGSTDYTAILMEALFPKGTDIRDRFTAGAGFIQDLIEISPGTGRYYNVMFWDDKAAGFNNEYRLALLEKNFINAGHTDGQIVDPEYIPPPMGPWIPPYTGP